jgi:hypothetical protein
MAWGAPVEVRQPGVYVISIAPGPSSSDIEFDASVLPPKDASRWIDGESVVYIGQTRTSLRKRLGQFYRHKYGRTSPHRGGQSVLLLKPYFSLWIHWSVAEAPREAEKEMLATFHSLRGARPFGNRTG